MKKTFVIFLVMALLVFTVACGPAEEAGGPEAGPAGQEQETAAPEAADGSEDGTGQEKPGEEKPEDGAAVVAESSNAVSSAEKEAVLEELDKELEDFLKDVNQLETVEEADLEIE